jgi:hypothetical protein
MSSTTGPGSGSKSEDMLATIMKQLAAMDARLQSMEGRLHAVDSIKVQVTVLEESTGELGAQHDTLSSWSSESTWRRLGSPPLLTELLLNQDNRPPRTATIKAAADDRGVMRMMEVKTSSLPHTNSSFPSMMASAIRYRGSTGARGTSQSVGRQNRNTSPWPPAIFSMTHNSCSIGWSSMGAVHPGHNSSN